MSLIPQENPVKSVSYLAGHNEPESKEYILHSDVYKADLEINCSEICIGVKFGGHAEVFSVPSVLKDEEHDSSSDNNQWKNNEFI